MTAVAAHPADTELPTSVPPEPMTATLTAPTRIKLTGLKRPAPDEGLSQLHTPPAELAGTTSANGGDANPGPQPPPKRVRPTREGVRRGKWTAEEQVRPRVGEGIQTRVLGGD